MSGLLELQHLAHSGATASPAARDRALALAFDVLQTGDFQQRWEVAKLLPQLGEAAIAPLLALLADDEEDPEVRWYAGRILAQFDDPRAIVALAEVASETDDADLAAMAAQALAQIGPQAIATLTHLLAAAETRLLAVQALAWMRSAATVPPLLDVADDPDPAVRATAIKALGSFRDPQIPPVLLTALADLSARVRGAAVDALSVVPDPQQWALTRHLLPLLDDVDATVCCRTAIALSRLGDPAAVAGLARVLADERAPLVLRQTCIRALGWLDIPEAIAPLAAQLDGEKPLAIAETAVTALGRRPDTAAVAPVLAAFSERGHQAVSVRKALAVALGQTGEAEAIAALVRLVRAPEQIVRLHAIAGLCQIPGGPARLQQLAAEADPVRRREIDIALAEACCSDTEPDSSATDRDRPPIARIATTLPPNPNPMTTAATYFYVLASQRFLLEEEPFQEVLDERYRYYREQGKTIDFWLVKQPAFLEAPEFAEVKAACPQPSAAIITTDRDFANWLKLRLEYVLTGSFAAPSDSIPDAIASLEPAA